MKKVIVLLFLSNIYLPAQVDTKEILNIAPVRVFNNEKNGIYFKHLPFIAVTDKYLFMMKNIENSIYRLNLETEEVDNLYQKGQGPGEFNLPLNMAVCENTVALMDNGNISFYNSNNKQFLYRFKIFQQFGVMGFSLTKKNLYLFSESPPKTIVVFDWKGNRINSFGESIEIKPNDYNFKNIAQYRSINHIVGNSIVLANQEEVFLVNLYFNKITRYSCSGIKEGVVFINENGAMSPSVQFDNLLESAVKERIKENFYFLTSTIDNARILDDLLFVSIKKSYKDTPDILNGLLQIYSLPDFNILKNYSLKFPSDEKIRSFRGITVRQTNEHYYVYLAVVAKVDSEISVLEYKIKKIRR